jgi:hypothetical protein
MMFSRKILAFMIVGALSSSAFAQPAFSSRRDAGIGEPGGAPLRIQIQVNLQRNIAGGDNAEAQAKAMENARRAIYQTVKGECGILSAEFDADCRLVNINAGSSIMDRGNMGPTVNANGNASYELTPRHSGTPEGK